MKQYRTRYITIYLVDQEYGGPEEGGWWYDLATVYGIIPFRNDKKREKAIKLAKKECDDYNNYEKDFESKYSYMFFEEENKKNKGKHRLTQRRYYE